MNHCEPGGSHCVTCGDDALPAAVIRIDDRTSTATVMVGDETTDVDISLVDQVAVGDTLLVHGGVALSRVPGPDGAAAVTRES